MHAARSSTRLRAALPLDVRLKAEFQEVVLVPIGSERSIEKATWMLLLSSL